MSLRKRSKIALLFSQRMTMHEPGHYEIVAQVPTGEGHATTTVVHHVRRIKDKCWVLTDEQDVILETVGTRRDACNEAEKRFNRLIAQADTHAASQPSINSTKPRYAFDRSIASAVLLEVSPRYAHVSLREAEIMVTDFLTMWHLDDSTDMSEFARRWVTTQYPQNQAGS